jgi:hypothetical protein
MTIKVKLSNSEIAVCQMIGNMRHIASRASSTVDRQMGNQGSLDIDQHGVIGEYAFCKYWNIHLDMDIMARSGSYDCKLNGKRIDIKSTNYLSGRLIATAKDNPDVDIYVLAIIDGNTVNFPGWMDKDNFITDENLTDLGHGPTYALGQDKLKAWQNGPR